MKNKKGFTLIELLAIIVILAIIAVITVPVILNIIDNVKQGAAKNSVIGYAKSVELAYSNYEYKKTLSDLSAEPDTAPVMQTITVKSNGGNSYTKSFGINYDGDSVTDCTAEIDSGRLKLTGCKVSSYSTTQTFNYENGKVVISGSVGQSLVLGTTVNYSTTLNGQTLNNWKVFLSDENYTYIIYGDYLSRAAISSDLKTSYNLANGNGSTYTIKSTTGRTDLINAMITTSNWVDLINNGELDGVALTSAVKNNPNVIAMGAPNIELWVNSWNSTSNGFTTSITLSQNSYGYLLNGATNLVISEDDKNKANYSLYLPRTSDADSCFGYWLSSPSGTSDSHMLIVPFNGYVTNDYYSTTSFAFRPVIKLPTSILN